MLLNPDGLVVRYTPGWRPDEKQISNLDAILINPVTSKPRKPLARDFPNATSKTLKFAAGLEGRISISTTGPNVGWDVYEGNHAIEYASNSNMGRVFLSLVSKVQWTRGSGGTIVGNDEYNQSILEAGGGANYVTRRFGPLGQEDLKFLRASLKQHSRR